MIKKTLIISIFLLYSVASAKEFSKETSSFSPDKTKKVVFTCSLQEDYPVLLGIIDEKPAYLWQTECKTFLYFLNKKSKKIEIGQYHYCYSKNKDKQTCGFIKTQWSKDSKYLVIFDVYPDSFETSINLRTGQSGFWIDKLSVYDTKSKEVSLVFFDTFVGKAGVGNTSYGFSFVDKNKHYEYKKGVDFIKDGIIYYYSDDSYKEREDKHCGWCSFYKVYRRKGFFNKKGESKFKELESIEAHIHPQAG